MEDCIERSLKVFPAGSNGEFNLPEELATVIVSGKGCELEDCAGRRFIDFSMGWGSVLVGHSHPDVVSAVSRRITQGANFAYVTEESIEVAEEIVRISPACDTVRFAASGSEATHYCVRMARGFTGRPKVMKFEGAYHGAHDFGVASVFPQQPPPHPKVDWSGTGTIPGSDPLLLSAPFNDAATTATLIAEHAEDLAAVIVEPLQRCTPPEEGFLEKLRQVTRQHGVLLIFDEVVTGFRLAYGGAQEYYGVTPDLVAYGKALGGGYPIGVYGGRADVMNCTREDRSDKPSYVWSASTLGGNPISAAASRAALAVYRQESTYDRLHALGRYLRDGMRRALMNTGAPGQVIGDGPLAQVVFTTEPIRNYRSMLTANRDRGRAVMLGLFEKGVFLNPMGTKLYLSLAHDEAVCDEFLEKFTATLRETSFGRAAKTRYAFNESACVSAGRSAI
ncbi:aspartate aminotransferase family protein [Crateriforma spongiae]|uniref:aspartate aminotransferase family protein n=1 Tax=Crateriforma spongiae TaxID=2724528 RepID=UPI0039B09862